MASSRFVVFVVAAVLLPLAAMAMEYKVGGDAGWTVNVNYTEWASDKMFMPGDVLVFSYDPTKHNVMKVDGAGFKTCNTTGTALTTGNDLITLSPGRKWYICGFPNHCANFNQKLVIDVMASVPAPAPNAAFTLASPWHLVVAAVLALMVMVV